MASPGELVQAMTEVLGLAKSTALVHDRHLVVAGLRSKHGRGRGAARVTAGDCARLLTAIIGSPGLEDSVRTVERYAGTRPEAAQGAAHPYAGCGVAELEALPKTHSFIDAVEAMIASAAGGGLWEMACDAVRGTRAKPVAGAPMIEITVKVLGTLGDIRLAGLPGARTAAVRYGVPTPWDRRGGRVPSDRELDAWAAAMKASRGTSDHERSGHVSERTIFRLGALLAENRESR